MGNPADDSPSGISRGHNIAGFGNSEDWFINEGERVTGDEDRQLDADERPWSDADLDWVDEITVKVTDSDGVDWYYTLHGPWESEDELWAEVDDLYAEYGGEAA